MGPPDPLEPFWKSTFPCSQNKLGLARVLFLVSNSLLLSAKHCTEISGEGSWSCYALVKLQSMLVVPSYSASHSGLWRGAPERTQSATNSLSHTFIRYVVELGERGGQGRMGN